MYTCAVEWPGPPESILGSSLQRYQCGKNSVLMFCGMCGTPVFAQKTTGGEAPGVFYVAAGLLPNLNVDLVKITEHFLVGDTMDGGASVHMQNLRGTSQAVPRWRKGRGEADGLLDGQ